MNQSNPANDTNSTGNPDNPNQEQPQIAMAMRFRKALLMAAVMLVIGWAIGVV